MGRRIKAFVLLICVIETTFLMLCSQVTYAKEILGEEEAGSGNVANELGVRKHNYQNTKHKNIEKKTEEEKIKYTGVIDKEKEKKINECGVLDEEIKSLSENELDMINSTPVEELEVYTSIYAYISGGEEVDENMSETVIELSEEQIDKMYAQEYYGEDNGFDEEIVKLAGREEKVIEEDDNSEEVKASVSDVDRDVVKSSYTSETLIEEKLSSKQMISICNGETVTKINETTRATSKTTSSYSASAQTAYLKKTLYANAVKVDGGAKVYITYINEWITMPENRVIDYIKVEFENLQWDPAYSCTVTHSVKDNVKIDTYKIGQETGTEGVYHSSQNCGSTLKQWKMKSAEDLYNYMQGVRVGRDKVEGDTYEIKTRGIWVIVPLQHNSTTVRGGYGAFGYYDGHGYYNKFYDNHFYSNEKVSINTTLLDARPNNLVKMRIIGSYYHVCLYKRIEIDYSAVTSAALKIVGNTISPINIKVALDTAKAAYNLSGAVEVKVEAKGELQGPRFNVSLNFKFK